MKNEDVIENFIRGYGWSKGSNLYIEGNKLINFETCIAFKRNGKIYMLKKKISNTTSTHQNRLRRKCTNLIELDEMAFENLLNN